MKTFDEKEMPSWVNFVCQNVDGSVCWFELEPKFDSKTGYWSRGFYEIRGRSEHFHMNMQMAENSLIKRNPQ